VGFAKSIGVFLNGDAIATTDMLGERVTDDSYYIIFNAHHEALAFTLPDSGFAQSWLKVLDTNEKPQKRDRRGGQQELGAGGNLEVAGRSIVLLERIEPD
jgi:glycogen operon protein